MKLFIFAALCSLLVVSANASQNVYLINNEENSFVSSGAPIKFGQHGLSSLVSAITGLIPGQKIEKPLSEKIESVVKPNPFSKPRAYVSFDVSGLSQGDISELSKDRSSRTIVLDSSEPDAVNYALAKVIASNQGTPITMIDQLGFEVCNGNCLSTHLDGASIVCGMKHEKSSSETEPPKLVFNGGNSMSLSEAEEKLFGLELSSFFAGVQRAEKTLSSANGQDVQLYHLQLSGLAALSNKFGAQSEEVQAARQAVVSLLAWAMETLEKASGNSVVFQVSSSSLPGVKSVQALANWKDMTKRNLLGSSWLSDSEDETAAAKLFTTKAAGYGSFVLLLYFGLAGVYCMCYMPLKKDTLLYSSGKKDL